MTDSFEFHVTLADGRRVLAPSVYDQDSRSGVVVLADGISASFGVRAAV